MTPSPGKDTYFISDLHLGARYMPDRRAHEERVVRFLDSLHGRAAALYMVGDVLDYWFEYRTVVPRGYVRFFGALARLADAGVKITWLIGNHDIWLFDYLRDEIGLEVVDGSITRTIGGRTFFIAHGDGLGRNKASFRFIRSMFRNRTCQKLFAAIHPRWTVPFAHRWSAGSRGYVPGHCEPWDGPMRTGIEAWAEGYAALHPELDYMVLGHRHVMVDQPVEGSRCRLIILGDWINHFSYAVFDGDSLRLEKFGDR
ncbi:MAG: UDP-2,3-diacylglucosamine diphosphatase [Muribaculaceae bacterium]|nr:UDP-2,3-diacylglucosamine diphosphatase [Muribaculaceae bacterium]